MAEDPRRQLPRMDDLLSSAATQPAITTSGRDAVRTRLSEVLNSARRGELDPLAVPAAVARTLADLVQATSLRPVLNATGVVLHTNLGRAPLPDSVFQAAAVAIGYVDVEFDLTTGERATRGRGTLDALRAVVPEAEDVLVVNNGAAALALATTTLAAGRDLLVSRGELVEIGDGFRLPDLITSTGVRIREVGTSNRTRLADYRDALTPDTGAVLKVHPSNFQVIGFTAAATVEELAELAVPVVVDVGSGLLRPNPLFPDEPDAAGALRAGAAVVTCSGDKLLGGPQAGLILGRRGVLQRLRRHPLYRAFRLDKLTLAMLEATLRQGHSAIGPRSEGNPTWRAISTTSDELGARSEWLARALNESLSAGSHPNVQAQVVPVNGRVGGGGAPGLDLPGFAVALPEVVAGQALAERLRTGEPAVVARVDRGRCLIDLRCIPPEQDHVLEQAVLAACR